MEPAQNQIALLRERPGRALCMGYSDPREMLTTVIAWTVILIVIELCSFGGIDWFVFITIAIAWLVIGLIQGYSMLVVVPRVRRLVRDGRIASATILDRWEHVSLSMAARSPAASLLIALLQARSNNFCLFTTYLFMTTDLFTLIYGQHRAFYLAQHDYC